MQLVAHHPVLFLWNTKLLTNGGFSLEKQLKLSFFSLFIASYWASLIQPQCNPWWSSTSLKVYAWSLLNVHSSILQKNERSWLFFPLCFQVLLAGLSSIFLHAFLKFRNEEQHVLPLFQHPDLLARPNATQEIGDVSPLKTSRIPFTEGELPLLQGKRGKVSFNCMRGKQSLSNPQ